MRYHLDIGKRHKKFITSFIVAKNYFSFLTFTNANKKEYKGFQLGKSNLSEKLVNLIVHIVKLLKPLKTICLSA